MTADLTTMHPLTGQLAAVVASTDAVPRLVRQFTALFLVTPQGDVWRIFDSDEASGQTRFAPANDPQVLVRVFMGSGTQPAVKLYSFADGESRSISAERLYEQLGAAKVEGA
jgi:hypothetical protein